MRLRVLSLFLMVANAGAAVTVSAPAASAGAYPGTNGMIAVTCLGICVMNPDGSSLQNLTNDGRDAEPAWSRDGAQIAFVRRGEGSSYLPYGRIYIMNADGSDLRRLGTVGTTPTWSPDGTQVAFRSKGEAIQTHSDDQIQKVNTDGSGLTTLAEGSVLEPSWGPGGKISFIRVTHDEDESHQDVYTIDGNGGTPAVWVTLPGTNEADPSWSPDGKNLIFTREVDSTSSSDDRLYVHGEVGSGYLIDPTLGFCQTDPAWSPDGTKITFWGYDCNDASDHGIYVMDAPTAGFAPETTGWQEVAPGMGQPDWQPCQHPDGCALADFGHRPEACDTNQYSICTGNGDDVVEGTRKDEYIFTGAGNDTISAGDGDDIVEAGTGNDVVNAGAGSDGVHGGGGKDRLLGEGGSDYLVGAGGNDVLKGGGGQNALDGGSGTDTCYVGRYDRWRNCERVRKTY